MQHMSGREWMGPTFCMHPEMQSSWCCTKAGAINCTGLMLYSKKACSPVWNSNCCLTSPVRPSQTMAVLSTEPDSSRSPFLFHLSEKMGPRWLFSVFFSSPAHHAHLA